MRRSFPLALAASLIALAALGSCVGPGGGQPPAPPIAIPAPTPAPRPTAPAPRPVSDDWRDWPLTPGNWSYRRDDRGSIALYGRTGGDADFTLRCDRGRGQVYLSRRGDGQGTLTIRTSSTRRTLDALPTGGTPAYLAVGLGPRDNLLDALGYSRGRFVVEGAGLPALAIPTWAEVLRVVEDCR